MAGRTPDCRGAPRWIAPGFLSHLDTRDLLEAAVADLSIAKLRACEAEVLEGQGRSGLSALAGLAAHR